MKNLEPDFAATLALAPAAPKRARFYRLTAGLFTGLALVAVAFHVVANLALNRAVRPKVEQALSARLPGSALRLGALRYDFWRNRLRCESLELTMAGGAPVRTGVVLLRGVHWTGLMTKKPNPSQLLRDAELEVSAVSADLAGGEYRIQCGHLHVSVPAAEVTAHALSLQPTVSDDAFFAADPFRRVRYRLAVASCSARGVGIAELFTGQAYRVESVALKAPLFESYVDREKPSRPPRRILPMPHEALAAIGRPFRLGCVTVTEGSIRIMGRRFAGAEPGVLRFTAVGVTAREIANAAGGGRVIGIAAEGRLMDVGPMTIHMSIPVEPATLAFHYSGTLGAMDLTRLNEYLSGTGGFEIKSGHTSGAAFEVDVTDGHARGVLNGAYQDLHVTVLDRDTGSEKGLAHRVATVVEDGIKVRHENTPDQAGRMAEGKIEYARTPEDTFLRLAWNALRSGIMDLLTL